MIKHKFKYITSFLDFHIHVLLFYTSFSPRSKQFHSGNGHTDDFSDLSSESDDESSSDDPNESDYIPNETDMSANDSAVLQQNRPDEEDDVEQQDQEVQHAKTVRPRKRKRNPQSRKHNKRKSSIVAGVPYTNYKGKPIPGKAIRQGCTCKKQCFDRLGEQNIQQIFEEFYKMPSKNVQDAYLFVCVKTKPPARRRPRDGSKGNRTNTFSYTVNSQGHEEQVCLNAFMNIHAIGKKRMARIKTSKASCTPPIDKRGMHGKHVRKPEEVREQVRNHFRSSPKFSHIILGMIIKTNITSIQI